MKKLAVWLLLLALLVGGYVGYRYWKEQQVIDSTISKLSSRYDEFSDIDITSAKILASQDNYYIVKVTTEYDEYAVFNDYRGTLIIYSEYGPADYEYIVEELARRIKEGE